MVVDVKGFKMTELRDVLERKISIYQKHLAKLEKNLSHNFRQIDLIEIDKELRLTPVEFNRLFFGGKPKHH